MCGGGNCKFLNSIRGWVNINKDWLRKVSKGTDNIGGGEWVGSKAEESQW